MRRDMQAAARVYIVAVKGNIQLTVVDTILTGYLFYQPRNTVRKPYAAGLYAYYSRVFKAKVVFYKLVCQPLQRNIQLIMIEQGLQAL